jgi:hypothetical protein
MHESLALHDEEHLAVRRHPDALLAELRGDGELR